MASPERGRRRATQARPGPGRHAGPLTVAAAGALAAVVAGGATWTALRVQGDLQVTGCRALVRAGLADGALLEWSGRDVRLGGVDDLGRATRAVAVLAGVRGVRAVRLDTGVRADGTTGGAADGGVCPGAARTAVGDDPGAGGAPAGEKAAAPTVSVKFATNAADLDAAGRAQLDALVAWLEDHPAGALRVEGHTDDTGLDFRNGPLSRRRAEAVADHLRGAGVRAPLKVSWYSSTRPLVLNTDAASRALNRRTDVVVEGTS